MPLTEEEIGAERQARAAVKKARSKIWPTFSLVPLSLIAAVMIADLGSKQTGIFAILPVAAAITMPSYALYHFLSAVWGFQHARGLLGDLPDVDHACHRDTTLHRDLAAWLIARRRLSGAMLRIGSWLAVFSLCFALSWWAATREPGLVFFVLASGIAMIGCFLRLAGLGLSFLVVSRRFLARDPSTAR